MPKAPPAEPARPRNAAPSGSSAGEAGWRPSRSLVEHDPLGFEDADDIPDALHAHGLFRGEVVPERLLHAHREGDHAQRIPRVDLFSAQVKAELLRVQHKYVNDQLLEFVFVGHRATKLSGQYRPPSCSP